MQVQCAFFPHFKCRYRKKTSRRVIQCLIQKFYATSSVLDDKKGKVGAKWTARKEEKEEARALVKENPCVSLTRLAQQLGILKTTTYHILREDIGLFPYKVHVVQKLSAFSKAIRLQFAKEFGVQLAEKPSMLNEIWFTNECHFWLNGLKCFKQKLIKIIKFPTKNSANAYL